MKILVIGGSYFYGRVFVMLAAKDHEITVVNRGTYSMTDMGVRQLTGDRRDEKLWQSCKEDFDVIVDFCGYEKGDIATVLRNMPGKVKQYIFISTVDVYERGRKDEWNGKEGIAGDGIAKVRKDESAPLEYRMFPGEAGRYIAGKVTLEQEVIEECGRRGMQYTILRPAVLYGPYNYAPRESSYIGMMVQKHILPHIVDADGAFQFVYVKDAANAVIKCLLKESAYGQAYNLCQDQVVTYDVFFEVLRDAADVEMNVLPVTAAQAQNQGIPLPFPVTAEETELCSNEKGKRELGIVYTSLAEGMARTYRAFKGVYGGTE